MIQREKDLTECYQKDDRVEDTSPTLSNDSYAWMKIAMVEVQCLIKKLQQHHGTKKIENDHKGNITGEVSKMETYWKGYEQINWVGAKSISYKVCSVEDPGSFCHWTSQ